MMEALDENHIKEKILQTYNPIPKYYEIWYDDFGDCVDEAFINKRTFNKLKKFFT